MADRTWDEEAREIANRYTDGDSLRIVAMTDVIAALARRAHEAGLEDGWRGFWDAFADRLRLGHEQRVYSWHDIMDAMDASRGRKEKTMTTDNLRRADIDKLTPAERAIHNAMIAVEKVGADVRLTDAVALLSAAQDSVADYVDGRKGPRRFVQSREG